MQTIVKHHTRTDLLWLALILCAGLIPRLYLLVLTDFGIESDEAIVGLMAKHIAEGRSWPVFYYGQDYMGSLEAIISAGFFKVFGISRQMLKIGPLLFSLLHIACVYFLARSFVGPWSARIAALLTAFGPSALILWSVKARGGFIELVVIGTFCLLISIDLLRDPNRSTLKRFFILGLVSGLGWWVNNQMIFYLATIGLVFLIYCPLCLGLLRTGQCLLSGLSGFFVGGAPFWYANIFGSPKWATFEVLFGKTAGNDSISHFKGFFTTALPIILGSRRFWSDTDIFPGSTYILLSIYALVVVLILLRMLHAGHKEDSGGNAIPALSLLLLFCVVVPIIFSLSSFGWLSRAPRYLLPLYSVQFVLVALAVSYLWERRTVLSKLLAAFLPIVLVLSHFASNYWPYPVIPGQPIIFQGQRVSEEQADLYSFLNRNNYRHIHTNYWIGFRTAFETNEEVTFTRFGRPRSLRIPEYEKIPARDPSQNVYVLVSAEARLFLKQLEQFGFLYRKSTVGEYTVIDQVKPKTVRANEIRFDPDKIQVSSGHKLQSMMHDRDLVTRWGSGMPQHPSMLIEIPFERVETVSGLDIDLGTFLSDAPRHLIIEGIAADGKVLKLFDLYGTKIYDDLKVQEFGEIPELWKIYFQPTKLRSLRLLQVGSTHTFDWSIAELRIYSSP